MTIGSTRRVMGEESAGSLGVDMSGVVRGKDRFWQGFSGEQFSKIRGCRKCFVCLHRDFA